MITNNYYYGNNQNMNTGKFNGDNSQYNFTNQKPVPINQIKPSPNILIPMIPIFKIIRMFPQIKSQQRI